MKPYIIGETAYHHEGNLPYLYKMIDDIAELKLSAAKFHLLLNADTYLQRKHPLFNATQKSIFTRSEWTNVFDYSNSKGLDIIALCDDIESIDYILAEHPDITALELHATSINDYYLLRKSVLFPGQIILGVSGSTIDEINYAVSILRESGKKDILLMYGFQAYPTNYHDINFSRMLKLRHLFDLPVGYADHTGHDDENNIYISALGAAMGINILEKHYTPEPGIKRIDYQSAAGQEVILQIKNLMEIYLTAYGDGALSMSKKEISYGITGPMKKAIVARRAIKKGEKLSLENLWFKRTIEESPLRQNELLNLLDLEAARDIEEDEIIDYHNVRHEFSASDYSRLTGGLEEKS